MPRVPLDGEKLPEPPNQFAAKARAIKAEKIANAVLASKLHVIQNTPVVELSDEHKKWILDEAEVARASSTTWNLVASLIESKT